MSMPASAAILAGGQSRRMGSNKSLLPFAGQPLIGHIADQLRPAFPEILVSANDPQRYAFLDLPVVPDAQRDCGPLMGILCCLQAARHELLFVTGCDIPTMNLPFIEHMATLAAGVDLVIPLTPDGRHEPLFAFYRKTVIAGARDLLAGGGRRLTDLLAGHRAATPPLPSGWLLNLNTPDDYRRAIGA